MEDRMNVLLDLDNTLINALEEHELQELPKEFQDRFDYKDMAAYGMRVFGRPNLQRFLDYLFANFKVSVFTAAEQEYALFIINNFLLIKPERKLQYMFFRYHVDVGVDRYDGTKDLRLLWNVLKVPGMYPCNTIIIDDLDDVLEANPNNTIRIVSFDVVKNKKINYTCVEDNDLERVTGILQDLDKSYKMSSCPRQIYEGKAPKQTNPFVL